MGDRRNYPTFIHKPRRSTTMQHLARPEQHGTTTGYHNGCRCDACYEANRDYHRARRLGLTEPRKLGRTHGLRTTYVHGCRCDQCRTAERDYQRSRRAAQRRAA